MTTLQQMLVWYGTRGTRGRGDAGKRGYLGLGFTGMWDAGTQDVGTRRRDKRKQHLIFALNL